MSDQALRHLVPIPADRVRDLLTLAARAPSILNTQPWRFRVSAYAIELYADQGRRLRTDVAGREMLMSCGAALFGLRLALRSLEYQPVVQILPDPDNPGLLARVRLGGHAPVTDSERLMLAALPHRHTHRGAFSPGPLPGGLMIGLQHDAVVEHATLALIDRPGSRDRLVTIMAEVARSRNADDRARADLREWVRLPGSTARDGIPAGALQAADGARAGKPAQGVHQVRRDLRILPPGRPTAMLVTPADTRADWIRAGQALHRLLLHAASRWVFANLQSQSLEARRVRMLVQSMLGLPGPPQLLLQFGTAQIAPATPRRPVQELIEVAGPRRAVAR